MSGSAIDLRRALESRKNPTQAFQLQRFFKTGPGQYGEGDVFWGLKVPETRAVIQAYKTMPLSEIELLLNDPVHECRLAAGLLLVEKVHKAPAEVRSDCFAFYLDHSTRFNNWDLVDVTCPRVVGDWLIDKNRDVLYTLAHSDVLWNQRIAMVSTLAFIRKNDLDETYALALELMHHPHDLMHKAVGWMLREAGKKNPMALHAFLAENDRYRTLPRTLLRYAIEKFPEPTRKAFLKGEICL